MKQSSKSIPLDLENLKDQKFVQGFQQKLTNVDK